MEKKFTILCFASGLLSSIVVTKMVNKLASILFYNKVNITLEPRIIEEKKKDVNPIIHGAWHYKEDESRELTK